MSNDRISETAKKLLQEARVDMMAVEKLRENPLTAKRAVFHLQQACEKALKAYFLLVFIKILVSVSELADYKDKNIYGRSYILLKDAKRFKDPRSFGHDLSSFFKYVDRFSKDFNYGRTRRYMVYLFKRLQRNIKTRKQAILGELTSNNKLNRERAERIFSTILKIVEYFSEFIEYYEYSYKPIGFRKYEPESEPCILITSTKYLELASAIDEKLDSLRRKEESLLNGVDTSSLVNTFPEIKDLLNKGTVSEAVSHYKNIIRPVFIIPLHFCLLEYEKGSRYPDSPQPSQEEIEALGEGIAAVENLIKAVECLFTFTVYES